MTNNTLQPAANQPAAALPAVNPAVATAPAAAPAPAPQAVEPAPEPRTHRVPRTPVRHSYRQEAQYQAPAPVQQMAPAPVPAPAPTPVAAAAAPPAPAPPPVRTVTVPAGTAVSVRLLNGLDTTKNRAGDTFQATLEEPLTADGVVIADRGAPVTGKITDLRQSGRVSGVAEMGLELESIQTVNGPKQVITEAQTRQANTSKKRDVATVGGLAGLGAVIGGIAGGGRGAGIGAAAGGAAGTGTVVATRGNPVKLPPETQITFALRAPLTLNLDSSRARDVTYSDRGNADAGRPRLHRREPSPGNYGSDDSFPQQ